MPKRPREAGPYECPECGNGLSRLSYLKEHIATVHRGEQAHRCPHPGCGKNFSQASSVKSHLRVHTGEHPFHCTYPDCGKSFTHSSNLQTHMASHSEERPHVCPHLDCGKSFKLPGSLKSHLASHSSEKPHACPYPDCGKSFKLPCNLKSHLASHSEERPHVCPHPDCGQSFKLPGTLKTHLLVHTGERPHACSHCDARFPQTSHLKKHVAAMHTERGQQRQKKREEAVARFLTQAGYQFEREARVDFCSARDAPCRGESRPVNTSLARLDFVLYRPWGVCVVDRGGRVAARPHAPGLRDRAHAERRSAARAALAGRAAALRAATIRMPSRSPGAAARPRRRCATRSSCSPWSRRPPRTSRSSTFSMTWRGRTRRTRSCARSRTTRRSSRRRCAASFGED